MTGRYFERYLRKVIGWRNRDKRQSRPFRVFLYKIQYRYHYSVSTHPELGMPCHQKCIIHGPENAHCEPVQGSSEETLWLSVVRKRVLTQSHQPTRETSELNRTSWNESQASRNPETGLCGVRLTMAKYIVNKECELCAFKAIPTTPDTRFFPL